MAVTTRKTPIKYRRGKPLPRVRHGDLIDLTTFPLGSLSPTNGITKIARCPKCDRKGDRSRYGPRGGPVTTESYTHSVRFETIFWMVKDSCTVDLRQDSRRDGCTEGG